MANWIERVRCPECAGRVRHAGAGLSCETCGASYDFVDGIPRLMKPETRDTLLDVDKYARRTGISTGELQRTYDRVRAALAEAGRPLGGVMLEIGTGSGKLTEALIRHAAFDEILTTDVSMGFLRHTRARLQEFSNIVSFLACDAQVLPFQDGCFDLVIGRSVLHHFLDYPATLSRVLAVLRPGGAAAFSEPTQAGMVLFAFFIRIMLEMEASGGLGLTVTEKRRITGYARAAIRSTRMDRLPEELEGIEDKYSFDTQGLCAQALALGFAKARFVNLPAVDTTYFSYFRSTLIALDVRREIADKMIWLKSAFGETVGAVAGQRLPAPTGYFVFEKG